MPNGYRVLVQEFKKVHDLPDGWTPSHLLGLLDRLEYGDAASIAGEDLMDMASLALSDLEPEAAAEVLLDLRLGERLRPGQRRNMAEEMKDERLWEEYADMSCHEDLFNVACMLHRTFPSQFPQPDVTRIRLLIGALNTDSETNLRSLTASFLARLLDDGMNDQNTLRRLFDEQIVAHHFPEAEDLIWKFEPGTYNVAERSVSVTIFISWHWVDELIGVREFDSNAHSDR
jgi:hypothetical protein